MGKIKMGGSAVMEFEPDYCEFHITVSVQKDTASESLTKGRKQVEDILHLLTEKTTLKINDIILQDENLTSSNYSDKKYCIYSKSFYFIYKNDNKFTDSVTELIENTDNIDYNINFRFENESEKNQIVLMAAVADEKEKAEKLAVALNTKIIGFEEILSDFQGNSRSLPRENDNIFFDAMSMFKSERTSLAAQMGNHKIKISKSVNVIWLTD